MHAPEPRRPTHKRSIQLGRCTQQCSPCHLAWLLSISNWFFRNDDGELGFFSLTCVSCIIFNVSLLVLLAQEHPRQEAFGFFFVLGCLLLSLFGSCLFRTYLLSLIAGTSDAMLSVPSAMNLADFHVPFLGARLSVSLLALCTVCIC